MQSTKKLMIGEKNILGPYGHRLTNCALNNVHHISKWILQYWDSLCDEHNKNTMRLEC